LLRSGRYCNEDRRQKISDISEAYTRLNTKLDKVEEHTKGFEEMKKKKESEGKVKGNFLG